MVWEGYEDNKTPRVCLSDSIEGCIAAKGYCESCDLILYTPVNPNIKVHKPTAKQCIDAPMTGEVWYTKGPLELKPIGVVRVGEAKDAHIIGTWKDKHRKKHNVWSWGYEYVPLDCDRMKK